MSNWILPSLFVFAVIRKSFHDKSINSIQCDFLWRFRIDRHCNQCNVTVWWFYLNLNISLGLGWGLFRVGLSSALGCFRVGTDFIRPFSSWGHFFVWVISSWDSTARVMSGPFRVGSVRVGSGQVGIRSGRGQFWSGSVQVEKFRRKNSWLNKIWDEKCMEGIILEWIFCWSVGRTEC